MIYTPSAPSSMWDTWIIEHNSKYYLYTLTSSKGERRGWDSIELAVSDDLAHWREHGTILKARPNIDYMGSGYTWKVEDGFIMNFSECINGIQTIYFAESDDLINWRRLGDESACRPDPRWYQVEKEQLLPDPRWDCIWVMPRVNRKGFIGFLTATAASGVKRGVAGCVISDEGIRFKPVASVSPPELLETLEIDAVERIGDLYYMVYNGFYFLVAEEQEGPYRLPEDENRLYTPEAYTYFGRFFRSDDVLLFHHHCIPRYDQDRISLGILKEVYQIEPERIALRYWKGNDILRGEQIASGKGNGCSIQSIQEFFTIEQHRPYRMEYYQLGKLCSPGLIIEAEVKIHPEDPTAAIGMYLGDTSAGSAFLANTDGRIEFGKMLASSDKPLSFSPDHEVGWKVRYDVPINMRVFVRSSFLEVYLDDMFVQCYSMQESLKGGFGFVSEGGRASLRKANVYQMNI